MTPGLDWALLGWASLLADVTAYTAARAWLRYRCDPPPAASARQAADVLLVRPCCGAEPDLAHTLASTAGLVAARGLQVVFAVPAVDDPARTVATRVARELRDRDVDARVTVTTRRGPNNKSAQLAVVLSEAPADRSLVVFADSDVDLDGVSLDALLGPLRAKGSVAAVWAPTVEMPGTPTLADRVSAALLGASLHGFPWLSVLAPHALVGKCFAVRRASLDAVGGFADLSNVLGEDFELGRRLRAVGGEVIAARTIVRARASGRSVRAVVRRLARWLTVLRAQRPALLAAYPLLFCATPIVIALGLALGSVVALGAAAVALAARLAGGALAARLAGLRAPRFDLALLADMLLLIAWVRALMGGRVVWRGRHLAVSARGVLVDVIEREHARRDQPCARQPPPSARE